MTSMNDIRFEVEKVQRSEMPLAPLFNGWYDFMLQAIGEHFPETGLAAPYPLLGVIPDSNREHRGMYLSTGPLGWPHWISINPFAFKTAADACQTIIHELCHWHCEVSGWQQGGHGWLWQATMKDVGIGADYSGKHVGYFNEWHDLYALALELGLDGILLS